MGKLRQVRETLGERPHPCFQRLLMNMDAKVEFVDPAFAKLGDRQPRPSPGARRTIGDLATAVAGATILAMTSETPRAAADPRPAWAAAEAHGCDMSLVESNLRKVPAERIRAHSRALTAALALRDAVESRGAGS